ncbi:MAG: sugar transferase [Candidatus Paceibacterota bacterium]
MFKRYIISKFFLLFGDFILIYLALFLALIIRHGDFSFLSNIKIGVFLFHFSSLALFWIMFLYILNFYEIPPFRRVFVFFKNLLIFFFLAGALGVAYFYLRPEAIITPKTILFLDIMMFSVLFCIWRYVFGRILKLRNFKEKMIVIGFRSGLEELVDSNLLSGAGYEVSAFFSPEPSFFEKVSSFSGLAKHGVVSDINELKKIIKKERVGTVVFPRFLEGNEKIIQQIFFNLPLKLNYISFADLYETLTKKVPIGAVNEAWFLENLSRSEKNVEEMVKRLFDIIFSFVWFVITVVLFPFVALVIKLDSSGHIFYTQKRIGKEGKIFKLYKFRTMVENAEQDGPQWAQPNDPRVTRIGKVLRKLYLDEFPQFYNILKGDISFVGPRPERPEFVEKLKEEIPYYDIRHLIKPGFTGWAQINYHYGASVEEAKEKLQYDLYYIKNRNFFMDLGIILKTVRMIFR